MAPQNNENPNKKGKEPGRPWLANFSWVLMLMAIVLSSYFLLNRQQPAEKLTYGQFLVLLKNADAGVRFEDVKVGESQIRGTMITTDTVSDGSKAPEKLEKTTYFRVDRKGLERDTESLVKLLNEKVRGGYRAEAEPSPLAQLYSQFIFILFILLAIFLGFMIVRWVVGNNSPLTFGRSRHKIYAEKDTAVTFKDVAGIEEAVAELREIVDFLQNADKYLALGGRIPKGVLLVGPPGTGKTLLAKAVAGEASVPFFSLSGSDFVEMFVGVGASRVRDLFSQAESRAPCIIFIDELDALGKTRGVSAIGGHDEREQTLNQLLVEMDGFDSNRGVIIMAATNRPETLDAALLRPGRFDRNVVVDRPDLKGREDILKVHTRHVKMGENVDLRHIASLTPGSVGADLANLVNEAALLAARKDKKYVEMADFEEAVERSTVGLERKSRIMSEDEKQRVAYHEAGHALVACALPNTHTVHKVSIIPRGVGALGYVVSRPDEDRYLVTQSELQSRIKIALAGTLAEEIVFNEISNGATNDLEQANHIARRMVKEFGMSSLGRISYPDQAGAAFLPGSNFGGGDLPYSEETAREIDLQVRKIIDEATNQVREILLERREAHEALAHKLIDKEVIDGTELRELLEKYLPGPQLVPGSGKSSEAITKSSAMPSEDGRQGSDGQG
ncbi:MAG: ATP-dependent zinc metalloprotease FtsH [Gemmataceae bacterium]